MKLRQILPLMGTIMTATVLILLAQSGWGAPPPPSIVSLTGAPTSFPPRVQTKVDLTATVNDTTFNRSSVQVQRQGVDGTWKNFSKTDFLPTSNPLVFTGKVGFNEASTGLILIRLAATFSSAGKAKVFSPVLQLSVGQSVGPSPDPQTIPGPAGSGTSITIPGGALNETAQVGISPAPAETFLTPPAPGGYPYVLTINVVFITSGAYDVARLDAPLQVTVPAPSGAPDGTLFFFAKSILAPANTPGGGLVRSLLLVDSGRSLAGQITSQANIFPGIFEGGPIEVVQSTGTYFIQGKICDQSVASDNDCQTISTAEAAPTVHVKDQSRTSGQYANADGEFRVEVNGPVIGPGPNTDRRFTLVARDQFRCAEASKTFDIANGTPDASTNTVLTQTNIAPIQPFKFTVVRVPQATWTPIVPGVRNGGFERGRDVCWDSSGTVTPIQRSGLSTTPVVFRDLFGFGTTIQPGEADQFVALQTNGAFIEQKFKVPTGVTNLHFDYHFGCDAAPANTACTGLAGPVSGNPTLQVSVNGGTPQTFEFKNFGGQLGWRTGKINVSAQVGTTVTLRFTASNPDAGVGGAILVDNIRFDTVFIRANKIATAVTDDDIKKHVRHANELFSQTGVNIRLRPIRPFATSNPTTAACNPTPFNFDETNTTRRETVQAGQLRIHRDGDALTGSGGTVAVEIKELMCLGLEVSSGDPLSEVQVYYVDWVKDETSSAIEWPFGVAVTPEDYHGPLASGGGELIYDADDTRSTDNASGIILNSFRSRNDDGTGIVDEPDRDRETLAHELGHLLLHKLDANGFRPKPLNDEEHGANIGPISDSANFMADKSCTKKSSPNAPCSGRALWHDIQQNRLELQDRTILTPKCEGVGCPH